MKLVVHVSATGSPPRYGNLTFQWGCDEPEDAVPLARFATYAAREHGAITRPSGRFGWRLLAANNRDVARSAALFDDIEECYAAIRSLRADFDRAVPTVLRIGRSEWSWRLRLGELDVAVSSRTYQRRLQCFAACDLFMELVREASISEEHVPAQLPRHSEAESFESAIRPE
jgi:uncharacterized protein YegP (UPF0339 family)